MSSKTDSVVKLAIVFFISLLSFSVGTFVGKKYSDNQHQMAMLEPQEGATHGEREVASVGEHDNAKKDAAMTDEEIAKLAQEFVADDNNAEKPTAHGENQNENHGTATAETEDNHAVEKTVSAPHEAEATHATKKSDEEKPHASAEKTTAKAAPIAHDERAPSSLPKNVAQFAVGKFTVQIASYADEAEAQKTASDLKNKGYSAFYVPASINGKTWYRVSVGQFATQKEAQSYRTEFISTSKLSSAIVQKISQ